MLFGGRPKLSIGMITGIPASVDNKYVPGSGVGRTPINIRNLKARLAYQGVPQPPPVTADISGSLFFANSSCKLVYSGIPTIGTQPFTFEGWFRMANENVGMCIFGTNGTSEDNNISIYAFVSQGTAIILTARLYYLVFLFNTTLYSDQWNHFAVVRDGYSNETAFVNGERSAYCIVFGDLTPDYNSFGVIRDTNSYGTTEFIGYDERYPNNYFGSYLSGLRVTLGKCLYDPMTYYVTIPLQPLVVYPEADFTFLLMNTRNNVNYLLDESPNHFTFENTGVVSSPLYPPDDLGILAGSLFISNDENTQYLDLDDIITIGTSAFTIECWVYLTHEADVCLIGANSEHPFSVIIYQTANNIALTDNGQSMVFQFDSIPVNQWLHISIVRLSSYQENIFINGSPSNSISYTGGSVTMEDGIVYDETDYGHFQYIGHDPDFNFFGYISSVRIVIENSLYDPYALSIPVPNIPLPYVLATALLIPTPYSPSYLMNFGSLPNGHFSIMGNNTISSPFVPSSSLYFNGDNTYLDLNQTITLGTNSFTIDAWVWISTKNGGGPAEGGSIFGNYENISYLTLIVIQPGNFIVLTTNDEYSYYQFPNPMTTNQWHHFAIVRDNEYNETAYMDGIRAVSIENNYDEYGGYITNSRYQGEIKLIGNDQNNGWNFQGNMTGLRFVLGNALYDPTQSEITVPDFPLSPVTGTRLLLNTERRLNYTTDSSPSKLNIINNGVSPSSLHPFTIGLPP